MYVRACIIMFSANSPLLWLGGELEADCYFEAVVGTAVLGASLLARVN